MILTMQQAADWQDIMIYRAMATPHRNADENLADDDDESFDDYMQDEDDLYELRTQEQEGQRIAPGDDDHLPEEELQ